MDHKLLYYIVSRFVTYNCATLIIYAANHKLFTANVSSFNSFGIKVKTRKLVSI